MSRTASPALVSQSACSEESNRMISVFQFLPSTWKDDGDVHDSLSDEVMSSMESCAALDPSICGEEGTGMEKIWVGVTRDCFREQSGAHDEMEAVLAAKNFVPVWVSREEFYGHYHKFAHGVMWPLLHTLIDKVDLESEHWSSYVKVNELFAKAVASIYRPGDIIWIHDYHLALVPQFLRRTLPDSARIAFFLHSPFPPSTVFRIVPWRRELFSGILGADLIGFQTFDFMRQFSSSLVRTCGIEVDVDRILYQGRDIHLMVAPMGIAAQRYSDFTANSGVVQKVAELKSALDPECKILLSIDQLENFKATSLQLLAIEKLLQFDKRLCGHFQFWIVTLPGHSSEEDATSHSDLINAVERINALYSTTEDGAMFQPIVTFDRPSLPMEELISLFLVADIMMVTPLVDGMNLLAKQYVASRNDGTGILILSEFAGAAMELADAVSVNPYNVLQVSHAVTQSLSMRPEEQAERMTNLRANVFTSNACVWAEKIIQKLTSLVKIDMNAKLLNESVFASIKAQAQAAEELLFMLDYDGTLVSLTNNAANATPNKELLDLLTALAHRPNTQVHVISGRSSDLLEQWFKGIPLSIHAEHGVFSRGPQPDAEWEMQVPVEQTWKEVVRPIFETFAANTPGAHVEEKRVALVYHYRKADVEFGQMQAKDLRLHLGQLLSNLPVQVLPGDKIVEVRYNTVNKGYTVSSLLAHLSSTKYYAVLIGDDRTDEDMFAALPPGRGVAIHVGLTPSCAPHCLPDVPSVRRFLRNIVDKN